MACHAMVRNQLQALEPSETELLVLPEYVNAPGLTQQKSLLQFAQNEGKKSFKRSPPTPSALRH